MDKTRPKLQNTCSTSKSRNRWRHRIFWHAPPRNIRPWRPPSELSTGATGNRLGNSSGTRLPIGRSWFSIWRSLGRFLDSRFRCRCSEGKRWIRGGTRSPYAVLETCRNWCCSRCKGRFWLSIVLGEQEGTKSWFGPGQLNWAVDHRLIFWPEMSHHGRLETLMLTMRRNATAHAPRLAIKAATKKINKHWWASTGRSQMALGGSFTWLLFWLETNDYFTTSDRPKNTHKDSSTFIHLFTEWVVCLGLHVGFGCLILKLTTILRPYVVDKAVVYVAMSLLYKDWGSLRKRLQISLLFGSSYRNWFVIEN